MARPIRVCGTCSARKNCPASYLFVLTGHGASRVSALAFNLHLAGSCIFARLAAIFFAGADNAATGNMCTSLLLNVVHRGLLDYSHRRVDHAVKRKIRSIWLVLSWPALKIPARRSMIQIACYRQSVLQAAGLHSKLFRDARQARFRFPMRDQRRTESLHEPHEHP